MAKWLHSVLEESHVTFCAIEDEKQYKDSTFTLYFRKLFWVTLTFWVAMDNLRMEPALCLESVLVSKHKLKVSIKNAGSYTAMVMPWICSQRHSQCWRMPERHFWHCRRDLQTGSKIPSKTHRFQANVNRKRKWRF